MPPAKKDVLLLILDLKSENKDQLVEGLIKLITHRMLCTKDMCNLLLVNSSETENSKNLRNVVKTGNAEVDPKNTFQCINAAEVSDGDLVDFLDVLMLAIQYLKPASQIPGVVDKQIIYFTDMENQQFQKNNNKISQIISDLNGNDISLYIVGPEVSMPSTITKPDDVPGCLKGLILVSINKLIECTLIVYM